MELGSETTPDVPARFALVEVLIHQVSSNDEVERPRDHLWRAADIVEAEKLDIVRLALYASRTARTDC
jgi:hypothetical protein